MDHNTVLIIALCVVALLVIAFFAVFRHKGVLRIKTKLGEVMAKGENSPPPDAVKRGVTIKDAEAGLSVRAHSVGEGGVDLERVKAITGDIDATHTPGGTLPPKT